jgi:hypothetical protein
MADAEVIELLSDDDGNCAARAVAADCIAQASSRHAAACSSTYSTQRVIMPSGIFQPASAWQFARCVPSNANTSYERWTRQSHSIDVIAASQVDAEGNPKVAIKPATVVCHLLKAMTDKAKPLNLQKLATEAAGAMPVPTTKEWEALDEAADIAGQSPAGDPKEYHKKEILKVLLGEDVVSKPFKDRSEEEQVAVSHWYAAMTWWEALEKVKIPVGGVRARKKRVATSSPAAPAAKRPAPAPSSSLGASAAGVQASTEKRKRRRTKSAYELFHDSVKASIRETCLGISIAELKKETRARWTQGYATKLEREHGTPRLTREERTEFEIQAAVLHVTGSSWPAPQIQDYLTTTKLLRPAECDEVLSRAGIPNQITMVERMEQKRMAQAAAEAKVTAEEAARQRANDEATAAAVAAPSQHSPLWEVLTHVEYSSYASGEGTSLGQTSHVGLFSTHAAAVAACKALRYLPKVKSGQAESDIRAVGYLFQSGGLGWGAAGEPGYSGTGAPGGEHYTDEPPFVSEDREMLANGASSGIWKAIIFIKRRPVDVAVTRASLELSSDEDDEDEGYENYDDANQSAEYERLSRSLNDCPSDVDRAAMLSRETDYVYTNVDSIRIRKSAGGRAPRKQLATHAVRKGL